MKINPLIILSTILVFTFSAACSSSSNKNKEKQIKATEVVENMDEPPIGLAIGYRAPDIEYPSPDGSLIKLSSLKGKVVLIDFWASWCPPCRIENPNLVNTYNHFKDKRFKVGDGFTIYSVSLDQDKERWVSAIKSDQLDWKYHVSDLRGWQSVPAAIYRVRSIPSNFLIDGKGVIIETNLRGEALGNILNKLLN